MIVLPSHDCWPLQVTMHGSSGGHTIVVSAQEPIVQVFPQTPLLHESHVGSQEPGGDADTPQTMGSSPVLESAVPLLVLVPSTVSEVVPVALVEPVDVAEPVMLTVVEPPVAEVDDPVPSSPVLPGSRFKPDPSSEHDTKISRATVPRRITNEE